MMMTRSDDVLDGDEGEPPFPIQQSSAAIGHELLTAPIEELNPAVPITLPSNATVSQAVKLMQEHHIGCVLVTAPGHDDRLAGIFTERDLLMKVIGVHPLEAKLETVMTRSPETLHLRDLVAYALNKMSVGGYRHVPIVDAAGKPVGIISMKDVANYLVELFPAGILNLPSEPGRAIPKTDAGA